MNREFYDKLIFEFSSPGRKGYKLRRTDVPASGATIPSALLRETEPELPEVDEPSVVRHYTNLSTNNFGVDTGFYPLGSCTSQFIGSLL